MRLNETGHTLLEMLVVLSLIALIGGMGSLIVIKPVLDRLRAPAGNDLAVAVDQAMRRAILAPDALYNDVSTDSCGPVRVYAGGLVSAATVECDGQTLSISQSGAINAQ